MVISAAAGLVSRPITTRIAQIDSEKNLNRFNDAAEIFKELAISNTLEEFLTLPAYKRLVSYTS